MTDQRDRLGPPAEGADARQAVLRLLRARRDARAAPRPAGVVGQVQGPASTTAGTRCASETFARQKELGVIPADAELTARPDEIPAWDDMPDDLKPVLARQMEVYAGFLEHTDHHVGRLIDALAELGDPRRHARLRHHRRQRRLRRGHAQRQLQRAASSSTAPAALETTEFMASRIDDFGTPEAYNHYAVGWAHAMDTPYQWTKQVASHWGGTRNGTIVHWPSGIEAKGEVRTQFHHVIDIAADRARRGRAARADVRPRRPADAAARRVAWPTRSTTPAAAERHETQYFEMFVQPRHLPQGLDRGDPPQHAVGDAPSPPLDDDVWELYAPDDWTQAHDLAAEQPEKLAELQRLFLIEAAKYNVLPARRPARRALQPRPRRPPAAHPRQPPAAVRRHGPAVRELGRRASRTSRTP